MERRQGIWLKSQQGMLKPESALVVDRVLGPVLAQGSTATGSYGSSQKGWPPRGEMEMTTSTIIAKNVLYMQSVHEYTNSTSVC